MERNGIAFIAGVIFALGLGVGGMTQPQNILSFLNVWAWNPQLLWVMAGALAVHTAAYRLIKDWDMPLLDEEWHIPQRRDITVRLVVGSMIFGMGWGLAGYCPGPALTSLLSGSGKAWIFVIAMTAGMMLFRRVEVWLR